MAANKQPGSLQGLLQTVVCMCVYIMQMSQDTQSGHSIDFPGRSDMWWSCCCKGSLRGKG